MLPRFALSHLQFFLFSCNQSRFFLSYFRLGLSLSGLGLLPSLLPLSSSRVATGPKIFVMLAAITFWLGSLQVLDWLDRISCIQCFPFDHHITKLHRSEKCLIPFLILSYGLRPRKGNRLSAIPSIPIVLPLSAPPARPPTGEPSQLPSITKLLSFSTFTLFCSMPLR